MEGGGAFWVEVRFMARGPRTPGIGSSSRAQHHHHHSTPHTRLHSTLHIH
jgi:hypothetical protein